MNYIRHNTKFNIQNTAIALGKFDGLHKGHQLLLRAILDQKKNGLAATVFTFDISPVKITTGNYDGMLMTSEEREQFLDAFGIDIVIEYPFTHAFSQMEPEDFVHDILIGQLGMRYLTVGEDFHFGRNQSGDVSLLTKLAPRYGFTLQIFHKLAQGTDVIGSTGIKQLVRKGNMEQAFRWMGHPYAISGKVISGDQLGRKLSFPTANLALPADKVLPPYGVYAVKMTVEGKDYAGIANLGVKPTVKEHAAVGLETFLFDFDGDLYQKRIHVALLHFIRPERRFDSIEALTSQIAEDVRYARQLNEKELL